MPISSSARPNRNRYLEADIQKPLKKISINDKICKADSLMQHKYPTGTYDINIINIASLSLFERLPKIILLSVTENKTKSPSQAL